MRSNSYDGGSPSEIAKQKEPHSYNVTPGVLTSIVRQVRKTGHMQGREELADLLRRSVELNSAQHVANQKLSPRNQMYLNTKAATRPQSSLDNKLPGLNSSRVNMLNTFQKTQNGLLQASALELTETGRGIDLKQLTKLHPERTRSQASLQVGHLNTENQTKIDSSRPSGRSNQNTTPGLNINDLENHLAN